MGGRLSPEVVEQPASTCSSSSSSLVRVLFSPFRMIMVPPRHYCVVLNPVARDAGGQVLFDQSGQAKLRHADLEIRLTQDPFPLYPGEEIQQVCFPAGSGSDRSSRLLPDVSASLCVWTRT